MQVEMGGSAVEDELPGPILPCVRVLNDFGVVDGIRPSLFQRFAFAGFRPGPQVIGARTNIQRVITRGFDQLVYRGGFHPGGILNFADPHLSRLDFNLLCFAELQFRLRRQDSVNVTKVRNSRQVGRARQDERELVEALEPGKVLKIREFRQQLLGLFLAPPYTLTAETVLAKR